MEEAVHHQSHETHESKTHHKKVFFSQKNVIIGIVVLVVLLLIGGGAYFVVSRNAALQQDDTASDTSNTQNIGTLTPDQVGLTMQAKPDNKQVQFSLSKADDISTIEYQIIYEADSTAEERAEGGEDRVQRGITGEDKVTGSSYQSKWLDLGSCSRNVCKYDTGVTQVDITLKITKKDGKIYQVQKSLSLQ